MDREPKPISETVAETALLPAANGGSAPSSISQFTSSSSSVDDEGRFLPGTLLGGRYRIVGLLGRGGMGEVYRAMDLALGQAVALKFLPEEAARNPRLLERFHGEVRVARLVSHPNVCRVFDIGEIDGTPFISMEYVDGEDLASLLTRIGRLPADKALQAARQLCAGLAAAHDRGVIHRDLKPQNVMMNKRGDLVIMDFGLAAIADQLSGAEVRNGTPAYMAPEQLRGSAVTPASDIYALGLVLYELFTGKRPYDAKTLQGLIDLQESAHLASMTSIATDVDPSVEKVIRRCLDPDPLKRPAGPLTVAAALPGGDPLAAALAAGETPSPELVANAGKVEGLALRYSIPCLAAIVASVVFACVLHGNHRAQMMDPLAAPPDVLAHAARQISASFGYTERPADSVVWVENRGDLVEYLNRQPGPKHWSTWFAADSPTRAYYREAPIPLIAKPDGNVERLNPPMFASGMTFVSVDGHGRLLAFSAVPRDTQRSATPEDVFRAARLDIATFHEVAPRLIPAHASDTIRAWEGPHPDIPNTELTVQVASWRGQITQASIAYPWMKPAGAATAAAPTPLLTQARQAAVFLLPILGTFFAALNARRNWKLGRTDRRGALRVAGARLFLGLIAWTGIMHPAPTGDMLELFSNSAAQYLLWSVLMWIVYLAVEPAIRARYPHAMITWNRLLAGRWLDAQVCAHVLIGCTVGCLLWVGVEWIETSGVHSGGNVFVLLGTRQWIARHALGAATGLTYGLMLFAVICFLRRLVRYDILAALAAGALFAMNESDVAQAANWQLMAAIFVVVFAILAFVLIRFGLVASISAIYFANEFPNIWLGGDWKAWYVPIGIASALFMLAIAGVAFWKSLGSQDLLGSET